MNLRERAALAALALVAGLPADTAAAESETGFATAIAGGKAGVAVRARYEHVDQEGVAKDANGLPTRLRLNYRSGQWRGFAAFAEFDHVFHVLLRDFNSGAGTSPNKAQYPIIADPDGSDLNQLYVDYQGDPAWKVRVGRQRILLDNQRFVGGVGWRQNEQTYDAFSLTTSAISNTTLSYSYLNRVRRIFGRDVTAGNDRVDGHLLNAKIRINDGWSVIPYLYYLDYAFGDITVDEPDPNDLRRAASSTATAGLRAVGNVEAGNARFALLAEFATQSDAADNPVGFDAEYLHLNGTWSLPGGLSVGLGFESLGGDSAAGKSFRTPLATLHAINGWADKFLATPAGGIDDLYLSAGYKLGAWNLTAVFHDFSAETGGGDYGSELDVSAGRGFGKRYGLLFKGAFFDADSAPFTDTTKLWIMFTASY